MAWKINESMAMSAIDILVRRDGSFAARGCSVTPTSAPDSIVLTSAKFKCLEFIRILVVSIGQRRRVKDLNALLLLLSSVANS